MSVKTIRHQGALGPPQLDRDWSRGIWHDCPIYAIRDGEVPGLVWEFYFDTMPKLAPTTEGEFGLFTVFSDTIAGGGINPGPTGGWLVGADGDNEGVGIRTRAIPFRIARNMKKLWYELRMKTSTVADNTMGFVHGLIGDVPLTNVMPITAAGLIADTNIVGIQRIETDGIHLDTLYKAAGVTQVTVQQDAATIAADTYFKSGFVFEPSVDSTVQDVNRTGLGLYNLTYYHNGIPLLNRKQIPLAVGTDFPNGVNLGWFFSCLNGAVATPTCTLDRVRVAQYY